MNAKRCMARRHVQFSFEADKESNAFPEPR
jgi:hypothetical protein